MLKHILSFFPAFFAAFFVLSAQNQPYVVMVSFDGFRNDYVERYQPTNFQSFIRDGASAEGLTPCFPSKTFPNHYSIVTGMYPGHHGLVDNGFYDPQLKRKYTMRDRSAVNDPVFYGGIPIWELAHRNGLKTASYFWVGSEAPVNGYKPDYNFMYDGSTPNTKRVNQVIDWLKLPENERPRLIMLYFSLVDDAGHDAGPVSERTRQAVMASDTLLGMLLQGIRDVALPVNVIITSDHGILEMKTEPTTYIWIDDLIDMQDSTLVWMNGGTSLHLYTANKQKARELRDRLARPGQPFTTYLRADLPKNWHYDHPRVGDLLLTAQPGRYFSTRAEYERRQTNRKPNDSAIFGAHGFDPAECDEMNGIFYANGPNIVPGTKVGKIENIHVYPLVAKILNLPLPKIDGDEKVLAGVRK